MAQTLEHNSVVTAVTPVTLPAFGADVDVIQQLDDEPNDVGGLSAQELKAKFDETGAALASYINTDLIPAVIADALTEQARQAAEAERVSNEIERVSNVAAALAKGLDDKQRNIYSGETTGDVLIDYIRSRIPKAREGLPTVTDVTGAEKANPGNLMQRIVNAMLNPVGVNEYTQSDVSREMQGVREATGRTDFYPTKTIPSELQYTKDGEKHEMSLNYAQRQEFQAKRIATQIAAVSEMMSSSYYKSAGVEQQANLLKFCYDYAYQSAKVKTLGGTGDAAYLKTHRMLDAGLSLSQWAQMKNSVDADNSGNTTKDELTAYIEANFPRSQWSALFDAFKGNSNWNNPY